MNAQDRKAAKDTFLASLAHDPNVSLACDKANISRKTAYQWRDDEVFAKAWDDAVERCKDVARSSIYQRGILGWDEPLVSMGQVVCTETLLTDEDGKPQFDKRGRPIMVKGAAITVHKWSDSLAALYAKASLPEYKDKPQVNINAQLTDLAEQAKNELLADLDASLSRENKEQATQDQSDT